MILYFSATGNSLAVARQLAEGLNERLMLLTEAVQVALIGDRCTVCLACVHACAQQAISTNGQEARKERQYRHPQIKLKDLLLR